MISVCVPTFNGGPYVAAQLKSILSSNRVTEVLVSDDGSTDDTIAVVEALSDSRVRLVHGPGAGLIRNYESVLSLARGDFIFLADQDDVWLPDKVEIVSDALREVDLVLSDCVVVDNQLQVLQPSFFHARSSSPGLLRNLYKNSYLGCCMAFRRELLGHALPFPRRVPMHDWWLGLIAETFGSVRFVHTPLVMYRRHGGNASSASERSLASPAQQLVWRADISADLLRRWLARRGETRHQAQRKQQ